MHLIGLNGFKRSGKNTVADIIVAGRLDLRVKTVGLADKLKIAAARSLGFDRSDEDLIALMDSFKEGASISVLYDEPDNPSTNIEDNAKMHWLDGRQFLQYMGTEAGRQTFGPNFWVDLVLPDPWLQNGWASEFGDAAATAHPGVDVLVVTDVRYENEAQRIIKLGGKIWEIQRPGAEAGEHASEKRLPDGWVDRVIVNDGDIELLRQRVLAGLVAL